jgi:hypothetical protein
MYLSQVYIANVVGVVVRINLSPCPIETFDPKFGPWFEGLDHGNVRMPPVVGLYLRRFGRFLQVGTKGNLGR